MLRGPRSLLLLVAFSLTPGCGDNGPDATSKGTTMGFSNPVYGNNFADPDVIAVGDEYYAFATNGPLGNLQTLRSKDLVTWGQVGDALPRLPAWTSPGRVWAPEIAVHAPDRYVAYYTTAHNESHRQCIGVAVASKPEGPYVDTSSAPLICQQDEGGSIDASPFEDSTGQRWLYWKSDGNAIGSTRGSTSRSCPPTVCDWKGSRPG